MHVGRNQIKIDLMSFSNKIHYLEEQNNLFSNKNNYKENKGQHKH